MTAVRKMTLNRNFNLISKFGHAIKFEKGVPCQVPPIVQAEALAIGAEYEDGKGVAEPDVTADNAPTDPGTRLKDILAAINKLVARNDAGDFTAANSPKVESVTKILNYRVASREIATAWQTYHDANAAAENE